MIPDHVARPLRIWLGSRLAAVLLTIVGAVVIDGVGVDFAEFLARWRRWDADIFLDVAEFGYFSGRFNDRNAHVFFPGTPMLVRAFGVVVRDWTLAALLVSAVSGAVGCWAVWRLAADEAGPAAGDAAVLALVAMPFAVFLVAGYSEPVFLAFAATAWLAARRGRWHLAGLLGAAAALTRVTGVPLALGLAVLYLTTGAGPRRVRRDALWLGLPVLATAAYVTYVRVHVGRWDAYAHALEAGWGRRTVNPLQGLRTTWGLARNASQPANYLWSWRAELAALLVGLGLAGVLLLRRRWGEATYVGSNVVLLSSSSFYASNARALLVWFPLYVLLGAAFAHRPWLRAGYLWASAPVAALVLVAFTRGAWIG